MKCKDCVVTETLAAGFTTLKCGNLGTKSQPVPNTQIYVYIQRNGIPQRTMRYEATSADTTGNVLLTIPSADRDFFSENLCYTVWMTLRTANLEDKQTFHILNGGQGADVTCARLEVAKTYDTNGNLVSIAQQELIYVSGS